MDQFDDVVCTVANCPGCLKELVDRAVNEHIAKRWPDLLDGLVQLMDSGVSLERAVREASVLARGGDVTGM